MKKITLTSIVTILGTLAFSFPVLAATTVTLTPANVKVATGQQFNMVVTVDPQGTKNMVEKVEVDFPADLLEVTSFTPGNGGMVLNQTGFDLTDNTNGVLVKTAGYTGGISAPTMFGTILFTAKKAGSGTVKVGGQSAAFSVSGQSPITGVSSTFTVNAASVSPTPKAKTPVPSLAPVTTVAGEVVTATDTPAAVSIAANTQVAAAAAVISSSTTDAGSGSITWVLVILVVILIVIIGYMAMRRKR